LDLKQAHNLNGLDLSKNPLDSIYMANMKKLSVFFAKNSLQKIDLSFCPNLRSLDLSENPHIELNLSLLTRLTFLDISSNNLGSVQSLNLNNFTKLVQLNLRSNNLDSIEAIDFLKINKLKDLSLSWNNLRNVDNLNVSLISLNFLDLSHNQIISVENLDFKQFPSLNSLYLSHNLIYSVINMKFAENSILINLDLSHNKIGFISNETFVNLKLLDFLNLEHNLLKTIGNHLIWNLKRFEKLYISQNLIDNFDATSFIGLTKLKNIYLSIKNLGLNDFCNIKTSISFEPKFYQRNILGMQYYYSTNLLDYEHVNDECELTLFFIKSNIQLNLFTDEDFNSFMDKCFLYDFNSEKKFSMKCTNDEKSFVDKKILVVEKLSRFLNIFSNFLFWLILIALIIYLGPVYFLIFKDEFSFCSRVEDYYL
jgi:Leucine-rich repeat (LRR) protein